MTVEGMYHDSGGYVSCKWGVWIMTVECIMTVEGMDHDSGG